MPPKPNLRQMARTGPKPRRKGNAGVFLGHLAKRLKMATKAKSAANDPNWAEIPSFWRSSGAPGQEAEHLARRLKIATKAKSAANDPNWAEVPSCSGAPGREAENGHQGQICTQTGP